MIKHLSLSLLMLFAACGASTSAFGQDEDEDDIRLTTIPYDAGAIIGLEGCINFQTMISFENGELVENVGLGDAGQWQVTPNKKGNLLFVKPIVSNAFSNMSIVTNRRSYNFELSMAPSGDCARGRVVYDLRFLYPPTAAATSGQPAKAVDPNAFLPIPEKRNTAYTYSGAIGLVPIRIFDDGVSTYLRWPAGADTPAVYAMNADNSESLINYATRGDYMVVEQVARGFVLRQGDQKTILYNDAYRVEGLDALSPKPRPKGGN
ncbi:TrbG/VirB9 family P-type conjugative transfer protein [Asticcacaulis biprosthecium]|nr:TrbG/VirB9 family P-type conjugative transfer protein [Asticcacaulis biprosthecium]